MERSISNKEKVVWPYFDEVIDTKWLQTKIILRISLQQVKSSAKSSTSMSIGQRS